MHRPGKRLCLSKSYLLLCLQTLKSTSDLKTSACCTAKAPPSEVLDVLRKVPEEVRSKYYGCGSPFPVGMSGQPLRVLDLGCGSGRDCYVCAALVGKDGHVTGIKEIDFSSRGHNLQLLLSNMSH